MSGPELCIAICRRCREPRRIASGADGAERLQRVARSWCESNGVDGHVRLSQCLNCCDGGHTVRLERGGVEVALVGVRTVAELHEVLLERGEILARPLESRVAARVYQVWRDGRMEFHRALTSADGGPGEARDGGVSSSAGGSDGDVVPE